MQAGSPEGPSEKEVAEADDAELTRELLFGLTGDDRYKGFNVDANTYAPNVDIETAKVQRASAEGMEKVCHVLSLSSPCPDVLLGTCFSTHSADGRASECAPIKPWDPGHTTKRSQNQDCPLCTCQ